ncbi:MAG: hypothetical protein M3N12_04050, partial [Verrucomicrobiota bacterium]|nr:hypothetical protein [Verrucomicrobiota bacterium]
LIRSQLPKLVLLDIAMPELGGLETLPRIFAELPCGPSGRNASALLPELLKHCAKVAPQKCSRLDSTRPDNDMLQVAVQEK